MKKFIIALILIFFTFPGFSQNNILYQKDFPTDYVKIKYSKSQIASDIKFMLKTLKRAHPNFYHNFTKSSLKHAVDSILTTLPDSSNIYTASLAMSEIVSMFNEGHLGLLANDEIFKLARADKNKFPYSFSKITDSALIVYKDQSANPSLNMLDSIISINDVPVYSIISKFKRYFGGLKEWRQLMIRNSFDYLLFANGIASPYTIKAKRNGITSEYCVDGIFKNYQNKMNNQKIEKNYKYSIIDKDIAYINFFSMSDLKSFKDSIKITFNDIKAKGINKLVIDLRYNGGGNSQLGEHLLTYLNEKPYRFYASMGYKISKPVKQYYRHLRIPFYYKVMSYLVPSGIIWKGKTEAYTTKKNEPFFDGKVVFLIGKGTFSSANMLANGIQDFNLATLIGESTAEPCNDYGEMISFMLPNTKLIARAPCKQFIRANGDRNNLDGVIPNYTVIPSAFDIKQKKDVVLDFAKNFLKKNEN